MQIQTDEHNIFVKNRARCLKILDSRTNMRIIIHFVRVIILNYFVTRVISSSELDEMFYHFFKT